MKRVFLTGASSGIGLAIAKLLVAQGHEVWGTSRNLERIPKMPRLHAIRLDLSDPTRRKCLPEAEKHLRARVLRTGQIVKNS